MNWVEGNPFFYLVKIVYVVMCICWGFLAPPLTSMTRSDYWTYVMASFFAYFAITLSLRL